MNNKLESDNNHFYKKLHCGKLIKILLVNIIAVLILIFIFDYFSYVKLLLRDASLPLKEAIPAIRAVNDNYEYFKFKVKLDLFDKFYNQVKRDKLFRPVAGENYTNKNPIILFGCSFAYGHTLPNEKTLSAVLSSKIKRTVYNFAYPGWGTKEILYIFQNDNDLKNIKMLDSDKQYIIYWYFDDHLRRLYSPFYPTHSYYFITYEKINDKLRPVNQKHPIIDAFYPYKLWKINNIDNNSLNVLSMDEKYEFLNLHLKEIMHEKEKMFPNAKFILLSSSDKFPTNEEKSIKDMGINLIYVEDITGVDISRNEEYLDRDGDHPNEKAILLIAENLAQILNNQD